MSFMSELQQALFDFQNKNGKALDPDRVAKSIIKSARKNSRSWGADSKPEIPNLFTVTVGTEDWNAYYGQRPEDIAGEMAYCVMRLAHNKGLYLASDPVISFEEDAAIPRGRCRVNAQFNFNERERLRREPIEATLHEEAAAEPEQQFDPFEPRNETPAIPAQQATVVMQPVEMEQPPAQPAESLQPEQQRTVVMQPVEAVADTAAPSAAQTTAMQPAGETKVLSPVEEAMPEAPAEPAEPVSGFSRRCQPAACRGAPERRRRGEPAAGLRGRAAVLCLHSPAADPAFDDPGRPDQNEDPAFLHLCGLGLAAASAAPCPAGSGAPVLL